MATFKDFLPALRAALREAGLQESPQAQESPQGFTRRHRGYRVVVIEVANTGKMHDRSFARLRYSFQLLVTHRLRPTPEDGFTDLEEAGTDYERIIQALMGDEALNALGDLHLGKFTPKLSTTGEWIEAPCTFTLETELSWLLDGGGETGA